MTREILIPHGSLYKDLVGNSDDKDALLCKTYGINNDELSNARQGTTLERAYRAAVLLREHDFGNQTDLTPIDCEKVPKDSTVALMIAHWFESPS